MLERVLRLSQDWRINYEIIKPKVARISDWNEMTEIIYCCPCCNTNFAFYRDKECYCHHCGQKIDWDYALKDVSHDIAMKYHGSDYEGGREIVKMLNKILGEQLWKKNVAKNAEVQI